MKKDPSEVLATRIKQLSQIRLGIGRGETLMIQGGKGPWGDQWERVFLTRKNGNH